MAKRSTSSIIVRMGIRFRFDPEKAIETLLYVANRVKAPTFHKVFKLLYFADRQHLQEYARFISGDRYIAMRHGPVPSGTYDLTKAARGDAIWPQYSETLKRAFAVDGNFSIRPLRDADLCLLSETDRECLDWAIGQYGSRSFKERSSISHDKAWRSANENDEIPVELIARTLDDGELVLNYLSLG